MGCNYLSLPLKPVSGTAILKYGIQMNEVLSLKILENK